MQAIPFFEHIMEGIHELRKEQNMNNCRKSMYKCIGFAYTIQPGDTLYSIGKKYNVRVAALIYANPYVNIYNLQVGDDICIPKMQPDLREGTIS